MAVDNDKLDTINEKSVYFQEILEKVPLWIIRWGNTIFFIVFGFLFLGLSFIKYPDIVVSRVKIETKNPSVIVRSLINEKISLVLRNDQEFVKKGDWIIILDSDANYNNIQKISQKMQKLESNDFWSSLDTLNLEDFNSLGPIRNNYIRFQRSVQEYSLFQQINSHDKQIGMNQNKEKSLKMISRQILKQEELTKKERDLIKNNLERHRTLFDKGVISKLTLEEKEIELLDIENQLENIRNSKQNTQLEEVGVLKDNYFLTAEQSNRFFELRDNILNNFTDLYSELEGWKKKYVLVSPIDGILNFYDFRNKNQFLLSEQEVFTVTPKKKQKFYAYLKMPIMNSGKVLNGQNVIIKLDNYQYTEFGVISGQIKSITKVPLEGNYLVLVDLPNQLETSSNRLLNTNFELVGNAEIITKQRSLLNRIFNFLKNSNN